MRDNFYRVVFVSGGIVVLQEAQRMEIFSCPAGANCFRLHCGQIRCRRLSLLATVATNIGFIFSPYFMVQAPPADSLNTKRGQRVDRRVARPNTSSSFIQLFRCRVQVILELLPR